MDVAMRVSVFCVVAAVAVLAAGTAAAADYFVSPDGAGDYPTIQAAVDAAVDTDTIILTDGTFSGEGNRDIVVPAKDIFILALSNDPTQCIIDCEGSARAEHRGFHFTTTAGTGEAALTGVGVINGYMTTHGGGIWIEGAGPIINNCIIANCAADGSYIKGGGLYVSGGAVPGISNCTISGNTADYGAGVAVDASAGDYVGCTIIDNDGPGYASIGGGVWLSAFGLAQFHACDIVSNSAARAGGIRVSGGEALLTSCNVSRNEATSGHSGGIWLQGGEVSWCTIVDNASTQGGGGVYCHAGTGLVHASIIAFTEDGVGVGASEGNEPTIQCCDVFGNAEGNYDAVVGDQTGSNFNFSLDPEFCGFDIEDYRLFDTSPCLAVTNCGGDVGAFDQGCDSPVRKMSWGRVKGMYR